MANTSISAAEIWGRSKQIASQQRKNRHKTILKYPAWIQTSACLQVTGPRNLEGSLLVALHVAHQHGIDLRLRAGVVAAAHLPVGERF